MNRLSTEQRAKVVSVLVEGNSLRATARITGVARMTVEKLLRDLGTACKQHHDATVRNLRSKHIQCDEIWSFVGAKQKNVPEAKRGQWGDIWTWTALDADSKLIVGYRVGQRTAIDAYSPGKIIGVKSATVTGDPNPKHISTSHVERQNLTMRMHMRRFTRLTNGFSKKIEMHAHNVALHFAYYNFCKIHQTLRVTPAMEAGLTDHVWDITELVALLQAEATAERACSPVRTLPEPNLKLQSDRSDSAPRT